MTQHRILNEDILSETMLIRKKELIFFYKFNLKMSLILPDNEPGYDPPNDIHRFESVSLYF